MGRMRWSKSAGRPRGWASTPWSSILFFGLPSGGHSDGMNSRVEAMISGGENRGTVASIVWLRGRPQTSFLRRWHKDTPSSLSLHQSEGRPSPTTTRRPCFHHKTHCPASREKHLPEGLARERTARHVTQQLVAIHCARWTK